jgi:hypothetical protein
MVAVVILALAGTASIGTAGLMDALSKADGSGALQAGRAAGRIFDVRRDELLIPVIAGQVLASAGHR